MSQSISKPTPDPLWTTYSLIFYLSLSCLIFSRVLSKAPRG
jgi:hypothetical protein